MAKTTVLFDGRLHNETDMAAAEQALRVSPENSGTEAGIR